MYFFPHSSITYSALASSYDWETYGPPSTNGSGGLRFIGMQRCIDCYSSPINALHARWKAQGWTSKSLISFLVLYCLSFFDHAKPCSP